MFKFSLVLYKDNDSQPTFLYKNSLFSQSECTNFLLMKSITSNHTTIAFEEAGYTAINQYLKDADVSTIFLLVDNNTHTHCLPYFLSQIKTTNTIEIIEIEAGEFHKNIDTCLGVWNALSELGADRKSLMINLGGGVITDLGGFVACTFKRGIPYINVPTTLLAMVDASVGGKTGVDLGALKNQIGVISSGDLVLIDTKFLDTLPKNQLHSGLTEMLKHGLISSDLYWKKMVDYSNTPDNLNNLIYDSVVIKNKVVTEDPKETGLRKTLNYGHTLGHAIESYCLETNDKPTLLHGEAIGIGLILETFISYKQLNFPERKLHQVKETVLKLFPKITFDQTDIHQIIDLLKFDKKNTHGQVNFVLLEDIGKHQLDCQVSHELIKAAFDYYEQ